MTQPTERRFVMEPRLDAEVETLNADKISHGTVVNSDVATGAAIDKTKIAGTAVTLADTGTVTSTMIANGTITEVDMGALDYVKFDTTYSGGSTQPGMINWNDVDGTLEFQLKGGNVTLQIGQEQVVRVKNNTGSTIANGSAVYISGSDGNNLRVTKAQANSHATSIGTLGVATEDLVNGNGAYVTTFGLVHDLNTSALTEGAPVYLSSTVAGGLTSTRPPAPAHSVTVGFCLRSHAVNGVLFVRVDTGNELDELHNVLITSPTNGQALAYDSATGLWKNATPASTLNDLTDVTINSGTLSGGQVIKYDAGTTQWVNGAAAGGVTASATAPNLATSAAGDAWFDTNDGTLYVCYVDVDSTKQWVQVQANSALEASILSRLGALEASNIAAGTTSPNYLINGGFDFWQRGTSFTSTGYTADRWYSPITSNCTVSQETSDLPTGFRYGGKWVTSGAGTFAHFNQPLERDNVIPLRGKTMTVSGYVKITGSFAGNFLSQISYSNSTDAYASVTTTIATKIVATSATTSWTRFTHTFTVPSDALGLVVNNLPDTVQPTGVTVRMTGLQLELGTTATAFRRNQNNYESELLACKRYCWVALPSNLTSGIGYATTAAYMSLAFPTEMRTTPAYSGNGGSITVSDNYAANYYAATTTVGGDLQVDNRGIRFGLGGFTGMTASRGYYGLPVTSYGSTFRLTFSAEL